MKDREVYKYHGWREQCKHITSEMYELTEAIHDYELCDEKDLIERAKKLVNITEEISDVEFMINQIKEYYEINPKFVEEWKSHKREREDERIKNNYYKK
jgi:NTP pyrophosphatase (non-canonical NTP hydrolase)